MCVCVFVCLCVWIKREGNAGSFPRLRMTLVSTTQTQTRHRHAYMNAHITSIVTCPRQRRNITASLDHNTCCCELGCHVYDCACIHVHLCVRVYVFMELYINECVHAYIHVYTVLSCAGTRGTRAARAHGRRRAHRRRGHTGGGAARVPRVPVRRQVACALAVANPRRHDWSRIHRRQHTTTHRKSPRTCRRCRPLALKPGTSVNTHSLRRVRGENKRMCNLGLA